MDQARPLPRVRLTAVVAGLGRDRSRLLRLVQRRRCRRGPTTSRSGRSSPRRRSPWPRHSHAGSPVTEPSALLAAAAWLRPAPASRRDSALLQGGTDLLLQGRYLIAVLPLFAAALYQPLSRVGSDRPPYSRPLCRSWPPCSRSRRRSTCWSSLADQRIPVAHPRRPRELALALAHRTRGHARGDLAGRRSRGRDATSSERSPSSRSLRSRSPRRPVAPSHCPGSPTMAAAGGPAADRDVPAAPTATVRLDILDSNGRSQARCTFPPSSYHDNTLLPCDVPNVVRARRVLVSHAGPAKLAVFANHGVVGYVAYTRSGGLISRMHSVLDRVGISLPAGWGPAMLVVGLWLSVAATALAVLLALGLTREGPDTLLQHGEALGEPAGLLAEPRDARARSAAGQPGRSRAPRRRGRWRAWRCRARARCGRAEPARRRARRASSRSPARALSSAPAAAGGARARARAAAAPMATISDDEGEAGQRLLRQLDGTPQQHHADRHEHLEHVVGRAHRRDRRAAALPLAHLHGHLDDAQPGAVRDDHRLDLGVVVRIGGREQRDRPAVAGAEARGRVRQRACGRSPRRRARRPRCRRAARTGRGTGARRGSASRSRGRRRSRRARPRGA